MELDFSEPFVQVAGITDLEEACMLIDSGVRYIGFPLCLDFHRPDMSEESVKNVVSKIKGKACPILITYLDNAKYISDLCCLLKVNIVQIHGHITIAELAGLRKIEPDLGIIKSLVIIDNNKNGLLNSMSKYDVFVDSFITDTFDPETGASGATGKVHNWEISRQIVAESTKPVILAGGLNPANVGDAILQVRPAGVDVHTGVEGISGRKEAFLVKLFVSKAKRALSEV